MTKLAFEAFCDKKTRVWWVNKGANLHSIGGRTGSHLCNTVGNLSQLYRTRLGCVQRIGKRLKEGRACDLGSKLLFSQYIELPSMVYLQNGFKGKMTSSSASHTYVEGCATGVGFVTTGAGAACWTTGTRGGGTVLFGCCAC